ncbi:MAG: TrmH family RNA methyltransferase [Bacteroidota bacterium]
MHKKISSTDNKEIKKLIQLREKSRSRKKLNSFLVEGYREISLALAGNYQAEKLYICSDYITHESIESLAIKSIDKVEITAEVYQKIAYRSSTEGVIAIFKNKKIQLDELRFNRKNPLILIAEAPEKPGNIGALLRTADAADLDAVLIANPKTDLYNPNIIRSSVGTVFTNQIAMAKSSEIIDYLNQQNFHIYSAILQDAKSYLDVDYTEKTALVVGTEADGLSDEWRKNSTQNIKIPMAGKIDSMNVSVAAGILVFEAKRQRKLKK